ncbi:uncharacterized protein [Diabrotica undecimpunctata]|uniref:uncharacterized protein n=1 Tax=Diabrotica undecimpunctata TaxID=50387 RepID=UPI003B6328B1
MPSTRNTPKTINKNVVARVEKLEEALQQGMKDLRSQVTSNISGTQIDFINKFEQNMLELSNSVKEELNKVQKLVIQNQNSIEYLKQDKRLKSLIINGVDEKEKDDLPDVITNIINNKPILSTNLVDCYRLGKKRNLDKRPRPVAVVFVNRWLKTKVFNQKKNLKGCSVVISEMLSPDCQKLLKKSEDICGYQKLLDISR